MSENGEARREKSSEAGRGVKGRRRKLRLYPMLPLLLWLVITAVTVLLFPHQGAFRYTEYTVGSISKNEIIAPFTFEILRSDAELNTERDEARRSIDPVFVRVDSIPDMQLENLRGTVRLARQASDSLFTQRRAERTLPADIRRRSLSRVREDYNLRLNEESWGYLLRNARLTARSGSPLDISLLETILRDLYGRGVLNKTRESVVSDRGQVRVVDGGEERTLPLTGLYDLAQARSEALSRLTDAVAGNVAPGDSSIKVGYELLVSFLVPNVLYDDAETELRRTAAVAKVPIAKGIVLKDERIIDSNERITERHLEILRSMEAKRAELASEGGGWNLIMPWVARSLIAGSIYFFFGLWLMQFRRDIFRQPNKLLLVWVMTLLLVMFQGLVILPNNLSMFLFPGALGAVILTIVFDAPLALLMITALSMVVAGMSGNDLFVLFSVFLSSGLSVYAVLRVRTRGQIMRASVLMLTGYVIVIFVRRMLTYQLDMTVFNDLMFATITSVATPLVALGMLILIELLFRVTSDMTLLELADLNRPLLKRLSLEAPGTYHHSIMVGNLAEAAAEAIRANSLLVRAGAYYHDIGKMVRREYFVENQLSGGNIHDSLDPEESARMVADHVTHGVRIAEQYHLPAPIKAFIREHHGTSLMVYFYNKALEIRPDGKVNEAEFRYPGPKPQSRETGILMLADSAEAATRSLEDPSPEKILEVVRNVIIQKYRDEELDECPLTLHDLRRIMEAFVPILQGIHHHRIQYPNREEMEKKRVRSASKAAKRGGQE